MECQVGVSLVVDLLGDAFQIGWALHAQQLERAASATDSNRALMQRRDSAVAALQTILHTHKTVSSCFKSVLVGTGV